jgi:phosphoglycolate phosphatase
MTGKQVVIFDLDGVLLDSETNIGWIESSIQKTLEHFHLSVSMENQQLLFFKNVKKFRNISRKLGLEPTVLWPIRNTIYTKEKKKALEQHIIKPFDDIGSLTHLAKYYDLGIISNSPQSIVDLFIEEFEYHKLFTYAVGRGDTLWDIEHMKPHPYLFNQFKKLVQVENFIYVGDTETDRVFAKRTGMKYIHLNRNESKNDGFHDLHSVVTYLLKT